MTMFSVVSLVTDQLRLDTNLNVTIHVMIQRKRIELLKFDQSSRDWNMRSTRNLSVYFVGSAIFVVIPRVQNTCSIASSIFHVKTNG